MSITEQEFLQKLSYTVDRLEKYYRQISSEATMYHNDFLGDRAPLEKGNPHEIHFLALKQSEKIIRDLTKHLMEVKRDPGKLIEHALVDNATDELRLLEERKFEEAGKNIPENGAKAEKLADIAHDIRGFYSSLPNLAREQKYAVYDTIKNRHSLHKLSDFQAATLFFIGHFEDRLAEKYKNDPDWEANEKNTYNLFEKLLYLSKDTKNISNPDLAENVFSRAKSIVSELHSCVEHANESLDLGIGHDFISRAHLAKVDEAHNNLLGLSQDHRNKG